ncbi:MAG: UDP-3-O-(3-hydroxymyristoyl)glucosamine N-acyltransferase [Syntrophobacteraceae bacterium]
MDVPQPSGFSLGMIAERVGATLKGDPEILIHGVVGLETASPGDLSFVTSAKYRRMVPQCRASALIVPPDLAALDQPLLIVDNVMLAFARASQLFARPPRLSEGIHPTAVVESGAVLAEEVRVGALSHVGERSCVGARTLIYGGAYVGHDVRIGEDCLIYPGVVVLDGCIIGNRVILQSGVVIGADGYGYAQDEQGRHVKIPQRGIVQIDDDVEIGANTTVDRAVFDRTWIQKGTKIDNQVMVAHNVVVGEHCILVAQVGISGSTRLGRHVILAGQVGVVGHLEIGDGARVGAKSGVGRSVKAGESVAGIPAVSQWDWLKSRANIHKIGHMKDELRALSERVATLEEELRKDRQ